MAAAFLDDLYIVTVPNRARAALEAVSSAVEELAGVAANLGKTRVYNRAGGAAPPGISELGPEAWRGDKPLPERGFVALGTPSAVRSTLPRARGSAWSRSRACWQSCHSCLTCSVPGCCSSFAPRLGRNTCSAPCRLPFRRRTRKHMTMRSGAHCKRSSASAAPLGRRPAALLFFQRARETTKLPPLAFARRPSLATCSGVLARAAPPAVADDSEPGDWPHGWQLLASRALNSHFRETELLPHMRPSDRACLPSQSGPHAGVWLAAVPTDPGTTLPPAHMHVALRRRLRLALPLTHRYCGGDGFPGCGAALDVLGDRAADCWPASRVKVWGPRAGLSLSSGWPALLRQASVRRTGAAWILFFTAPRAWAKRCAATPRSLLRSVATADRSHARPGRTAQPLR